MVHNYLYKTIEGGLLSSVKWQYIIKSVENVQIFDKYLFN